MTKLTKPDIEVLRKACQVVQADKEQQWWIRAEIHDIFEANGLQIQPSHFYSPMPSPDTVRSYDWSSKPFDLDRINFNRFAWIDFLDDIGKYSDEFSETTFPRLGARRFPWDNHFYTGLDALALYAAVRRGRPKRVVEIGSGYSTHVTLSAMQRNGIGEIFCIEPYPTEVLQSLSSEVKIIKSRVQEINLSFFDSLQSGDILFVDSSHVSAFQSDVNYEFLKLLPRLQAGVQVHIHDIFFPWEYPKEWLADRRWYWNEQYLLYALLLENSWWELTLPTFYTWNEHANMLRERVTAPIPGLFNGGSMWLKRLTGSIKDATEVSSLPERNS